MDFVVVGFGVGALGVLLGVLLRGWLAGRCERAALRATEPTVAAYERANAAESRDAGQAFLAAGGAVALSTVGGLAGGLDDRNGALLVATTATVAALGIILWGYLYRLRNPMPPRPRRHAPYAARDSAEMVSADLDQAPVPAAEPVALSVAGSELVAGGAAEDTDAVAATIDREGAEPTGAVDGPEDNAMVARPEAQESDEGPLAELEPAANGRAADDPATAEPARIAAFVARGGDRDEEGTSASRDDKGAEER